MNNNEFKCAVCNGIFEKGYTEEEALNELDHNNQKDAFFAGRTVAPEECAVVCDDCYNQMGLGWKH